MNKFLIQLTNSKSFKENDIDFTNKDIYIGLYEKFEIDKLNLMDNESNFYLSCFFSSNNYKLDEIVGNYIFIFLKNPKILYGLIKVDSVIIPKIPQKNYLEEYLDEICLDKACLDKTCLDKIHNEDINKIILNNNIIINKKKYDEIIRKYKIVEIPKMFLIKFKYFYEFKYEILIRKFNQFVSENYLPNYNFSFPLKIQNKQIFKINDDNFCDNLLKYNEHLSIRDKIFIEESNLTNQEILINCKNENNNVSNCTSNKVIKFNVPILWNGCDEIKQIFKNFKISKKIIVSHFNKCSKCEIVNNNTDTNFNISNKKIVIKNIENNQDHMIFDQLIEKYKNVDNFFHILGKTTEDKITNDKATDINFSKNDINIIRCPKSKSIYKDVLFII